jgi:hypothetical protein
MNIEQPEFLRRSEWRRDEEGRREIVAVGTGVPELDLSVGLPGNHFRVRGSGNLAERHDGLDEGLGVHGCTTGNLKFPLALVVRRTWDRSREAKEEI